MAIKKVGISADPLLIKPGDIVRLDSRLLVPTRGDKRTWSHYAVCLFCLDRVRGVPLAVSTDVYFQFICISSITPHHPLDLSKQVRIPQPHPAHGLTKPSAACVDFSPMVDVAVRGNDLVLDGVERLLLDSGHAWTVGESSTLQAIFALFNKYWNSVVTLKPPPAPAESLPPQPKPSDPPAAKTPS